MPTKHGTGHFIPVSPSKVDRMNRHFVSTENSSNEWFVSSFFSSFRHMSIAFGFLYGRLVCDFAKFSAHQVNASGDRPMANPSDSVFELLG